MNAKIDFRPIDEPVPISSGSPLGQRMLGLTTIFGAAAGLTSLQEVVGSFAFFMGHNSILGGMDDETFDRALEEFAHMARVNRAGLQKQTAGRQS